MVEGAHFSEMLRVVKICFVELESAAERVFRERLAAHEICFAQTLQQLPDDTEIASIFINERITAEILEKLPSLRMITTRSRSIDHIDLATCRARQVTVCAVPYSGETTVGEHTFALILALSRRLREIMALPKEGRFSYEKTRGMELAGKTLGIIGMGRIGRRVATLAHAFEMRVIAYDVEAPQAVADSLQFEYVALPELFRQSHVISLHANLRPETYHILDQAAFAQCRPGVLIVNTARGALIDTQALREALDSGQVGGAGLDVLQDERVLRSTTSQIIAAEIIQHLRSDSVAHESQDADRLRDLKELMLGDAILERNNVVFTPHVAFNSIEAVERVLEETLANITAYIAGKPVNVANG